MSKPGVIYQSKWITAPVDRPGIAINGKEITVNIYDTETLIDDAADETIYSLTPAGSPLTISVVDNAEDKLTPVRAKQAVIRFLSNSNAGQDATTFFDSSANRWKVVITCDAGTIFIGYLVIKDVQQDFLPDPVLVELTATDRLASLKDIALTDFDGLSLQGKYKIGQIIAMCLQKTKLDLVIKVINNVRHGTGQTTFISSFAATSNQIIAPSTRFFYVGQQIIITGTASNNITTTVTAVGQGIVTIVEVSNALVNETDANATFTDDSSGHLYDKIYLDAKTFESNIGESEDCRTVLEKILGEDCVLFQWKGFWYIYRLDEIDENQLYEFTFDAEGNVGANIDYNPTRGVGSADVICHAQLGTTLRTDIRHKFIKETFKYVTPKEIVCNMDFSRGGATVPPDLSAGESEGHYILDCWTFWLWRSMGVAPETPSGDAYIVRKFVFGTENERYVEMTNGITGPGVYHQSSIRSQGVNVQEKDKISAGISYKWDAQFDVTSVVPDVLGIELVADDGTYWYLHSSGKWFQYFVGNNYITFISAPAVSGTITTDWQNFTVDSDAIPRTGVVYVYISQMSVPGTTVIRVQGLSFTLTPFINGSYQLFTGQFHKVTRTDPVNDIETREKEVFISDSPRKEFKGAMFFQDSNGIYRLGYGYYASNVSALGPPVSIDSVHSFGHLQAYSVWNQYRLANRIFPSSLYGYFLGEIGDEWADLIQKYSLTDTNPNTNNRYFLLISFEQDWKTCLWRGTFIQVYDRVLGHAYSDTKEFNYISEG